MAQTFNLSFLLENAPSDEYRQELMKLLKPSKTEYLKTKFQTLMSFVNFIESHHAKSVETWEWDESTSMECKIYGSFVRQYFEMIYSTPLDKAYGNIYEHDVDIRLFDRPRGDKDKQFFTKMIDLFKLIVMSKNEEFTFNGYKLLHVEDKTITNVQRHDPEGKKLLSDIPHYLVVLEKDDDQIHIDLLAHSPIEQSTFALWNNDFDVNGLYMSKRGILTHKKANFFDIQNSIMNRNAEVLYPIEKFIDTLKNRTQRRSLNRGEKMEIYNQLIHFIAFRTKIEEVGYTQVSSQKMLSLSVEETDNCEITDFEAPYIKVGLECSHSLSIMALANLVNVRSSNDTEAIVCPYCRADLIPKLVDSQPFEKVKIPEVPRLESMNKERVKKLNTPKDRMMMSQENMSCITGLVQGLNLSQVRERHSQNEFFSNRYVIGGYTPAPVTGTTSLSEALRGVTDVTQYVPTTVPGRVFHRVPSDVSSSGPITAIMQRPTVAEAETVFIEPPPMREIPSDVSDDEE